jgi:hypothetical protein
LPEAIGRAVVIVIASCLCASCFLNAQAELAMKQGYWYLGEGAQEGMALTYKIQRDVANGTREFEMTVSLNGTDAAGHWVANFSIFENGTKFQGNTLLRSEDLYPVTSSDNSTEAVAYFHDYVQSIQYLGTWSTRTDPLSLQGSWGGLACEGCPRAGPVGSETISVAISVLLR